MRQSDLTVEIDSIRDSEEECFIDLEAQTTDCDDDDDDDVVVYEGKHCRNEGSDEYDSTIQQRGRIKSRLKKTVKFCHYIEIREHPRVLGDHPCVSSGPPISIGWYDEEEGTTFQLPFDEYEIARSFERRRHDLRLSSQVREKLLEEQTDTTEIQMLEAEAEAHEIQAWRSLNYFLQEYEGIFLFIEECIHLFNKLLQDSVDCDDLCSLDHSHFSIPQVYKS